MKLLFLIALCYLFHVKVVFGRECIARNYGNNGTVCVCNITYCDNISPLNRTRNGVITLYESTRSGLRLRQTGLRFNGQDFPNRPHLLSQTIQINGNIKYQKINGFGGAFTDSAGLNIRTLADSLQINLISDYFSPNGLEYTLGRVPIAGTDFSTHPYTYDDVANDTNLSQFRLQAEDYYYKIPYIKLAKTFSSNKLRLFACPWSPPAWLKTTKSINNGGTIIGQPGNNYYQIWAKYFVKFLNAYKRENVEFWALTVQNEPATGYTVNFKFNGLGMTPALERDFIKLNLGPTLQANGYGIDKLKVMIGDDQRPNMTANIAGISTRNPSVYEWARTVFSDNVANKYVSGIGFHWYLNHPNNTYLLDQVHQAFPNYFILATEACSGAFDNIVLLGSWKRGEDYANDIIQDLNHFTTGWVDWNLALNLEGGPNWVNNFVDSPVIINASAQEYYKQPMFYALAHFSKFLPPDSVRINVRTNTAIANFRTTAFQRPDNGTVVIVVNSNDQPVRLTINVGNGNRIRREVLPHSFQSYIWWN